MARLIGTAVVCSAAAGAPTHAPLIAQQQAACVDHSNDPAGCQPSTFDTPMAQMPSVRVNRQGKVDPTSSEADAKAGAFELEKRLHLFRNFEHLHWVVTVPSEKNPATGAWRGGDLDGAGDGRGLGIAGNCIFVGHANGAGVRHAINIFRIQPNPERQPPVQVGEIPAMFEGNEGFDDRELRALVHRTSSGQDRFILVRNAGTNTLGRMETYQIDPNTCLPTGKSEVWDFHAQSHEFFLWHDPANPNRILAYMTNWTGGVPDPENPGLKVPDLMALAVTDAATGEMLPKPKLLAGFTLQEVGGPPIDERADATGLFSDGRFADFSDSKNALGPGGQLPEPRAEPSALGVGDRRRRTRVRGRHDGRLLRPQLRGCRSRARSGVGSGHGRLQPPLDHRVGWRRDRRLEASRAGQRLPAHGGQRRSRTEGVSRLERIARDEGAAVSRAAHPIAVRRLPAGERLAHRDAQRRVRAQPTRARPRQRQGPSRLRVAIRRERRLPAELRAHGVGGVRDGADHGGRVRDPRQPRGRVPDAGDHRARKPAGDGGAFRSRTTTPPCSRTSCSPRGTRTGCAPSTSRTRTIRAKSGTRLPFRRAWRGRIPSSRTASSTGWTTTPVYTWRATPGRAPTSCRGRARAATKAMPPARIGSRTSPRLGSSPC